MFSSNTILLIIYHNIVILCCYYIGFVYFYFIDTEVIVIHLLDAISNIVVMITMSDLMRNPLSIKYAPGDRVIILYYYIPSHPTYQ